MTESRWIVGDVHQALADLPDQSIHSVITSPPYWRKRRYLPPDHPAAHLEIGQEPSPAEFLATLLRITDELYRIVRDDGTIWVNLGDTAAGSGGAGGDYDEGGQREGQSRYEGSKRARPGDGMPLAKSVCWLPELFGASLAYGRNLLTGEPCRQWITRPPVTWCKPAVTPGAIIDKFREATELIVWASKQPSYYFDLDAVRQPPKDYGPRYGEHKVRDTPGRAPQVANPLNPDGTRMQANPKGVPPLNYWVVNTSGYKGAHFATFPPALIERPVIASCPPDGWILDPFGGSGTTAQVATRNSRNCLSIDLDARNEDLAANRVGLAFVQDEVSA